MEKLTLKEKLAIHKEIKNMDLHCILTEYTNENFNSQTLKSELIDIYMRLIGTINTSTSYSYINEFLHEYMMYEIKISAKGTEYQIIEQLKEMIKKLEKSSNFNEFKNEEFELDSFEVDYKPTENFEKFFEINLK